MKDKSPMSEGNANGAPVDIEKLAPRIAVTKELALSVYRSDRWLCRWCGRPVIFSPTLRYLKYLVLGARNNPSDDQLPYWHPHWTRRDAPLLDAMGAVIDHVDPHSRGGKNALDNYATACNKCNARKSNTAQDEFRKKAPRRSVKAKYGEPEHWDGLSTLFVILIERSQETATASERDWLRAIKAAEAQDLSNPSVFQNP